MNNKFPRTLTSELKIRQHIFFLIYLDTKGHNEKYKGLINIKVLNLSSILKIKKKKTDSVGTTSSDKIITHYT